MGAVFGIDLRPSRVFVWAGPDRSGQRIIPLDRRPRILVLPRRRRQLHAGPVRVTLLGNPLITLGQAGLAAARATGRARRQERGRIADGA